MSDTEKQTEQTKEEENKQTPKNPQLLQVETVQKEDLLKVSNRDSQSMSLGTSFNSLPVQSARLVTIGDHKNKFSPDYRFIKTKSLKDFCSLQKAGKIKNLIYRNQIDKVISQEKTRLEALEETLMFQRERRFNKHENMKKCQRSKSRSPVHGNQNKKFRRTQEKKKLADKKFKRNCQQPQQMTQQGKLLHARLVKKLREDPLNQQISRIPERLGKQTDSVIVESHIVEESSGSMDIDPVFAQNNNEGVLQPSDLQKLSQAQADIIT